MSEPTIILINRGLSSSHPGMVAGMSGSKYGDSYYESAYAAHVCRMSVGDWRKCRADVTAGVHRPMCRWEVDVELPESPVTDDGMLGRIRDASPSQLAAIISGLPPLVQAVYEKMLGTSPVVALPLPIAPVAPTPTLAPVAPPEAPITYDGQHSLVSMQGLTYRGLLKIAREVGVESPERFDTSDAVKNAIIERQSTTVASAPAKLAETVGEYFDIRQVPHEPVPHNLNVAR